MTATILRTASATALSITLALLLPAVAVAQSAEARYAAAQARESKVRAALAAAPLATGPARTRVVTEARAVIGLYEALVQQYRASGYADNALYNGASLADTLHERFRLTTDRDSALRLYRRVTTEYPTTPLAKETEAALARMQALAAAAPVSALPGEDAPRATPPPAAVTPASRARLTGIERMVTPETVRVTLSLDREVSYYEERLEGPARVFFDFKGVRAAPELTDAVLRYPSDLVRQIRVGRHPDAIRVVLDLEGVGRHSVYTLYNPFRIVIDAEADASRVAAPASLVQPSNSLPARAAAAPSAMLPSGERPPAVAMKSAPTLPAGGPPAPAAPAASAPLAPAASLTPAAPLARSVPEAPAVNGGGNFSIARQLGLGISRVVIDPGHGGHDPGASARGLSEAALTLDVALRLEQLLQEESGVQVVLTRRSDVYVPLEERTALANREGADLFLSIHANTSRNATARGVETYFLSFAATAEAEAVAARENAAHAGDMHKLPDMIKAITLNNKLDESRDFAGMVQEALVTRLRRSNQNIGNRGVKKAPFVVLIGAEMPSVLAEISFMTNKQELQLLKTPAYKQRIAEALHAAVMRYRRSLKASAAIADR